MRPSDVKSFVPSPTSRKRRNWIQSPSSSLLCWVVFVNAMGKAVTGTLFNLLVKFYIFPHHFKYWNIFTSLVMFYILGKNCEIVRLLRVLSLEVGSSRPSSELGCCDLWREANTHNTHRQRDRQHSADTSGTDPGALQPTEERKCDLC